MIALAALAAVAFAPPTDRPLLFRTQQALKQRSGAMHFSMVERVRFARLAKGWRMSVTTTSSGTDASPAHAGAFDLMMSAFDGVTTTYILSTVGRPIDVVDPDRVWQRSVSALDRALAVRFRSVAPADRAPLIAFRDAYAATPPAARRSALIDNAAALLPPARLPTATSPLAFGDVASDAEGRPVAVAGTMRRVASAARQATFRIDAASAGRQPAADRVRESRVFTIAARDGLLLSSDRRVSDGNGPPLIEETITRLP